MHRTYRQVTVDVAVEQPNTWIACSKTKGKPACLGKMGRIATGRCRAGIYFDTGADACGGFGRYLGDCHVCRECGIGSTPEHAEIMAVEVNWMRHVVETIAGNLFEVTSSDRF